MTHDGNGWLQVNGNKKLIVDYFNIIIYINENDLEISSMYTIHHEQLKKICRLKAEIQSCLGMEK